MIPRYASSPPTTQFVDQSQYNNIIILSLILLREILSSAFLLIKCHRLANDGAPLLICTATATYHPSYLYPLLAI
jgi:hypothetical protein